MFLKKIDSITFVKAPKKLIQALSRQYTRKVPLSLASKLLNAHNDLIDVACVWVEVPNLALSKSNHNSSTLIPPSQNSKHQWIWSVSQQVSSYCHYIQIDREDDLVVSVGKWRARATFFESKLRGFPSWGELWRRSCFFVWLLSWEKG